MAQRRDTEESRMSSFIRIQLPMVRKVRRALCNRRYKKKLVKTLNQKLKESGSEGIVVGIKAA